MKLDPFIEAEKFAGHSVNKTCGLFEVSSSAYYQRRDGAPSARQVDRRRADRTDPGHPRRVQGDLWLPADPPGARPPPGGLRQTTGDQAHADRRPRGPVQEALAEDHGADPEAEAAKDLHPAAIRTLSTRSTAAMSGTSPTSPPGRAGPTWPPLSTWPAARWWAGHWPITCGPNWSRTHSPWPLPTGHQKKASFFTRTAAVNIRVRTSPISLAERRRAFGGEEG